MSRKKQKYKVSEKQRIAIQILWLKKGHGKYPEGNIIKQDVVHKIIQRTYEWAINFCQWKKISKLKTWGEVKPILVKYYGSGYEKLANEVVGWLDSILK